MHTKQFCSYFDRVLSLLAALTARQLADDAVRAVPAGARFPQAGVALDPEAGVGREDGKGHVVRLPVGVGHLGVLAPHQASTCSQKRPETFGQGGRSQDFPTADSYLSSPELIDLIKVEFA